MSIHPMEAITILITAEGQRTYPVCPFESIMNWIIVFEILPYLLKSKTKQHIFDKIYAKIIPALSCHLSFALSFRSIKKQYIPAPNIYL